MSGEDSGVDAGSNESNESVCMSFASSVSDYEQDLDNEDNQRVNNNVNINNNNQQINNNNENNGDHLLPNV